MSKFASDARTAVRGPIGSATVEQPDTRTREGGAGWTRDPKSELFLLAVTNLVAEDTFYESGDARDARFRGLIGRVVADDPEWVARLIPWLRNEAQMRTAPLVAAVEYAAAGGPDARKVVDSAMSRGDEPAEALAYWLGRYGKPLAKAVQRGIRDAAERLYSERAALKYDSRRHDVRMGDVISLTHPAPRDERQSALFRYLLGARKGQDPLESDLEHLKVISDALAYASGETDDQAKAGSWERASARGAVDWETQILRGDLGYMATLRNLRNFDEAEIGEAAYSAAVKKLTDPEEVARSRQLPIRFLSAWKAVASMRWGETLERALDLSLANVPELDGRTLVLWDCSLSMNAPMSGRSQVNRYEVAGVFAIALARRAESADVVAYSNQGVRVDVNAGTSILRTVEAIRNDGRLWHGTDTFNCLAATYADHDRVVIITDEQAHRSARYARWNGLVDPRAVLKAVPRSYTLNVAGYEAGHLPEDGRHVTFGGLNDRAFTAIDLIERTGRGSWPF